MNDPGDKLTDMADGLVTVREASKLLGLSRSFLYVAMDRGELSYAKFGKARRIPRAAILRFAARHLSGGK
jgi:excisionase family DNA binding protein